MMFRDIDEQRMVDADHADWTWKELVAYYSFLGFIMLVIYVATH